MKKSWNRFFLIYNRMKIFLFVICVLPVSFLAQKPSERISSLRVTVDLLNKKKMAISEDQNIHYQSISPRMAGIYSALLPGLGQYYNKKYWKIPIVLGGIGVGIGIMLWNQKNYLRYYRAFQAELNGQKHEFSSIPGVSKEALGRIQDQYKRQRDYSIAVTSLVYLLNIMDAVVDAHLYDQKHDPDLTVRPTVLSDIGSNIGKAGLAVSYKF
ncbi:MAG: hypothetical protein FDW93_03890 [Bergeyella sp.]|nr:hypothetical protein [Bergeyella sp.]